MRNHQRQTTPQAASVTLTRSTRFSSAWRCAVTLMLATGFTFNALQLVSASLAMINAGRPTASLGQAQAQTTYVGESSLTEALRDNQVQPLALASADFDEDGMPDLVAGYATSSGGGIVTIQRGNINALFPYGDALREGEPRAFLPTTRVFALPESPDFIGTGDFDADGHWDVVAAKRGSSALFFMQGDQLGGLRAAERTELSGSVTALMTGELNRRDGLTDLVVGTNGPEGSQALVFESPEGALKGTREVFDLPAAAVSFALGQFAGDYDTDLAIAAGNNLLVVAGRDRKLSLDESQQQQVGAAVITSRHTPFSIDVLVAGNFSGNFEGDLALGAPDGRIFLLTPPKVAVTKSETFAAQVAAPATDDNPSTASAPAAVSLRQDSEPALVVDTNRPLGDWLLSEVADSSSSHSSLMQGRLTLIRARVSGAANDDLMVTGGENRQLRLMKTGSDKRAREVVAAAIAAEEEPVAVLPMRLNQDGISDLVMLTNTSSAPVVVPSAPAAVFTVNTAADINNDFRCDATYCSLRGAISAANANPGADMIVFNIPGTGVHTINTVVGFTNITDPVTIDGYTQPGSSPNTLANGDNAVLLIEINGAAAQQGSIGLSVFNGDNNVFRGLAIGGYRFQQGTDVQAGGFGIALHGSSGGSDNNFVEGCFVGTNAAGTVANPNNNGGIFVFQFSDDNTFGGTTPAARNLFSGNGRDFRAELNVSASAGCSVCTTGNKVQGNFVGTDITGTTSLEDGGAGIFFFAAHNSLIGGTTAGARNIISGKQTGISFQATGNPTHQMPGALVQGNLIGLDVNGAILSNSTGMSFGAVFDTTFGGTTPAAANTSSGNTTGIFFANNATNNLIQGNFIGTDVSGVNKGNSFHGIFLSAARQNVIGGAVPGAGNVIAFTNGPSGNGIRTNTDVNSNRNTIRGNSIHSNTLLGIDLAGDGVTPNDACDADTGPNERQNFPALTDAPTGTFFVTATATNSNGNTSEFSPCVRAQVSGGNISIQGTLESVAAGNFTVDFYSNSACDSSGNGEGQTFLGSTSVTTASCNAVIAVSLPTPTPTPTPTPGVSSFQFLNSTYVSAEDVTFATLTVTRTGDISTSATVDYGTANGAASERSDYTTAVGTLRFAAGETSQTFVVLVNEDSLSEGLEQFTVALSNPTGGSSLGVPSTATVQITDDASEPATNVIDDAQTFVGQHYHDFLNRQHDSPGLNFWTSDITICGADAACIDNKRTNVSQAFFLSIEFQQTGYLVFRIYKQTYTDSVARPRGMPRYREFLRDTQEIGRGVVVGAGNWEQQLEANKQDFALRWVQKPEFITEFPLSMTAAQFVDKLFLNAETTPTTEERNAAIAAFGIGDVAGRAAALRSVADSGSVYNRQFNPAFVLMQYIGYLRRNPNDAPEPGLNYAGFDFWLAKMNQFSLPGEDVRNELVARARVQRAEMVRAFIVSSEYRGRFGP